MVLIVAFAAGAVPFSYLVAQSLARTDLRQVGTGTVSGTGLYRVTGFIPLAVGGLGDVGKGALGTLLAGDRWLLMAFAGAVCVIGHNWSMFLNGAGGRGLSPALGAFAVIIAVARRTASGDISSYAGLFRYAPGLAILMSVFVFSLAGIPPLGGWFAKFAVFRAVVEADTGWGYSLAAIAAINSVIALFYYAKVARMMWFENTPEGADTSSLRVPPSLVAALGLTAAATLLFGIYPAVITHFTDGALIALP